MSRTAWVLVPEGRLSAGATTVELDAGETRHLTTALRGGPGDPVVLLDGDGWVGRGSVESMRKGRARVTIAEASRQPHSDEPPVTLAVGILHGQAMDWALQKAVEIGVRRFVPVLSEHVQLSRKAALGRAGHWRRVSLQALKQCQRPWAMEVEAVRTMPELVDGLPAGLVADPGGRSLAQLGLDGAETVLVGPEGGLARHELDRLDAAGWRRLRLGPHVLRAETAAVVGAAVVLDALRGGAAG